MSSPAFYVVEYQFYGKTKTFICRAIGMNSAEAWHWASCDAGFATTHKFGRSNSAVISKTEAERQGITDVKWRLSGSTPFTPEPYIPPKKR